MFSPSNSSPSQLVVPSAREVLNKLKMKATQEVGANLKQGYSGDLASRKAGSVDGRMVKRVTQAYESSMR